MSFNFGQRVRLTRDLQMCGFNIPKGIEGTVTNVHLQTSVLFDGLDQQLAVADSDIETVSAKPKSTMPKSTTAFSTTTPSQKFRPSQRVRLLVTKHIDGQTIPVGSLGIVTQDAPSMSASWVLFDGFGGDKLIPNVHLEIA